MTDSTEDLSNWMARLLAAHDDRTAAIQTAYSQLESANLLAKVTLHRYQCSSPKACQIARVIQIGDLVLCSVRDYKYSPGMNIARSVPAARAKNTLDGDSHWPGHVHDVSALAEWGAAAGISMVCRHYHGTILAVDMLETARQARPGHPGKPTRLSL